MEIKEIQFEQVRNLGDYQSKRWSVLAVIHPGDDVEAVHDELEAKVLRWLYPDQIPPPPVPSLDPDSMEPVPFMTDDPQTQDFITHERGRFRHLVARAGKTEAQGLLFYRTQHWPDEPESIANAEGRTLARINEALEPLADAVAEIKDHAATLGQHLPSLLQGWAVSQHTPSELGSFSREQAQGLAAVLRAEVQHPGASAAVLPPPSATPAPRPAAPAPAKGYSHQATDGAGPRPQAGPRPVTEKQLAAVYAIAKSALRMNRGEVDAECQERFGCPPSELTRIQASEFIDALKGGAAS